jgi:hypothetical protein
MKTVLPTIFAAGLLALFTVPVLAQAVAGPLTGGAVRSLAQPPSHRDVKMVAGPMAGPFVRERAVPPARRGEELVALNCHGIGQRKAGEVGGQLAKATPVVKDGKEACQVVILIPAKNGSRPRRAEFVIYR